MEGKTMNNKWIKFKQPAWIGLDFDYKRNPLIDWEQVLDLKGDDKTIGYDFKIVAYRKISESDIQDD